MESKKTVFITGADRGIGFALCQEYLRHGWHVIAGQFMNEWKELEELGKENPDLDLVPIDVANPDSVREAARQTATLAGHVDALIHVAGIILRDDSPDAVRAMLKVNAVGPISVTQNFLPLMKEGEKRLCFVSSEAGSISLAHRRNEYGYGLSKTALNMAVRMMFQTLRKDGYLFRLYHPGWVNSYMETDEKSTIAPYEPEETAKSAYLAFTRDRQCEDVLVMTDINGQTWSF
ncbi:MAG: SDR family NAD(P)-dependent oxidoreductase [Lachnospiraceae bacterium]|nr:SDR family NAD(P)-dependent oxidoreductase [Lachnospiraceae bacterium]